MATAMTVTRRSRTCTAVVFSCLLLGVAGCNSDSPASPDATPGVFNFAGNHAVTMTAGAACTDLPSTARTRTYSATAVLYPTPLPNLPEGGTPYLVQMSGATFQPNPSWAEYAYGTFPVAVAGNVLTFPLLTFDGRPGLVENTSSHTYVAFSGNATASPIRGTSTVSATFDGWIEFCAASHRCPRRPMATPDVRLQTERIRRPASRSPSRAARQRITESSSSVDKSACWSESRDQTFGVIGRYGRGQVRNR